MTKMTYVDALNIAIAAVDDATAVEKLTALRESVIKRNSKPSKPTAKEVAKAQADEALAQVVLEVLEGSDPLTVTQIQQSDEAFAELKVQKLSAIIRKLMLAGSVKRDIAKGKAVFTIA